MDLTEPRPFVVPHGDQVRPRPAPLLGETEPPVARQPRVGSHDHRGEQPATRVVFSHRQRPEHGDEVTTQAQLAAQLRVGDRCAIRSELDEPISQRIHALYLRNDDENRARP